MLHISSCRPLPKFTGFVWLIIVFSSLTISSSAGAVLVPSGNRLTISVPQSDTGNRSAISEGFGLVNPFIGSGGLGYEMGNIQPGPQAPHGLVRLGPDTSLFRGKPVYGRPGGYYYRDRFILGFSHTHLTGTGAEDYGNVTVMPLRRIDTEAITPAGRAAPLDHSSEQASPGYYSIELNDRGVLAELTALPHSGIHRYTFEPGETGFILLDAGSSLTTDGCSASYVEVDADGGIIRGRAHNNGALSGRYGGFDVFFFARFEAESAPISFGTWNGGELTEGGTEEEGKDTGAWFEYDTSGGAIITVYTGISYISMEQAELNLESDLPADKQSGFDECRQISADLWQDVMDEVTVSGGTEEDRIIFYSALYRLHLMPTDFTEAGGKYKGFDGMIHDAGEYRYYSDMSLWDTYRTFHPLMTLIDTERARDMAQSLVRMYEQGGDIPRWPLASGYTGSMTGTHADIVFADAVARGVRDFDVEKAYEGCRLHAMEPRPHAGRDGIEYYIEKGYCPVDLVDQGPSKTLEYAYDDYALANLAEYLGYEEDATMFTERSRNYENTWFGLRNFFRGRNDDGTWHFPFVPTWPFDDEFTEGDAWQWNWAVPFDANGLIDLFGSKKVFLRKLGNFFYLSALSKDTLLPDSYYWHGNEPDLHAVYLFDYAGRPDLTQKWVHWIMDRKYGTGPAGLDGNDDGGTLSAWFIYSSLGFYPLPGSDTLMTGSPRFSEARIRTGDGELTILALNAGPDNRYVRSVKVNGRTLSKPFFTQSEIARGGIIEFEMCSEPDTDAFPDIRN